MADPCEYLKIKYSVPTGACKCGNCQLVPPEELARWADELRVLRAAMKTVAGFVSSLPSTDRATPKPAADMRQIFSDGDNTHRWPGGRR